MDNNYYVLDGHTPKAVKDVLEWATAFESQDRLVEKTTIGDVDISTVFLGLNHRYGDGEPLLFETMIFSSDENDGYQTRCSTWEEAVKGHKLACEKVSAK